MRIGLVTGEYPPMEGGVGAFTEILAREMVGMGHEVYVLTSREGREESRERRVSDLKKPLERDGVQVWAKARRWNWKDVGWVADVALRFELDVVNVQYQPAAFNMRNPAINFLPFRLKGLAKSAVTFHDLRTPYLFPKAGGLRDWVVKRLAVSADGVIATNHSDYTQLTRFRTKNVHEIPIGSNITVQPVSPQEKEAIRDSLGKPEVLLAYFGFLNPSKGGDLLIKALAELDEAVHLVFIGGQTGASDDLVNSAYLEELRREIRDKRLEKRVHWTGFVEDEAVSAYFETADLVVLPYTDGASLRRGTLMAALAHGRPLITTRPQAKTPLVHGENCWLIPPDHQAIVKAVNELRGNPLKNKLGENAKTLSKQFEWSGIAGQTVAFFESLL